MRRSVLFVSLIIAALLALVAVAAPNANARTLPSLTPLQARQFIAANPCTGFRFGADARAFHGALRPGPIEAIRVGRHSCFDRLVVDIRGPLPGWGVKYRDALIADGSGRNVPFRGRKIMEINLNTNAHNINTGRRTFTLPARPDFPEFKDLILAGDFEGQTQIGVGVANVRPFRVFTLPGARGHTLWILDVKH